MTGGNVSASGGILSFEVRWVFGGVTSSLRQKLVAFWIGEGALESAEEAWRRSWEVACILQDRANGDLAGVCTVAIGLDERRRTYGLLRIYVATKNRHPGLNMRMMQELIKGFTVLASEPGAPQRLVATIENPKIERRGGQRLLAALGFESLGRTPQGALLIEKKLVR